VLQELERILLASWEEFGFTGDRPERFLYLLSAERHWHSKSVFYCLPHERWTQAVVVKIQREDVHLPLLENEYRRLKTLHAHEGLWKLKDSIPRPLYFGRVTDHPVLIETYMPGAPFSKYARRREPESFLKLSKWLRAFHSMTRCGNACLGREEIEAYFLGPLESAIRASHGCRPARGFLISFRKRLEDLRGQPLPFVFGHNDLCLNNIRFHENRINVIDWEFSRHPDLPVLDLINAYLYFVMMLKKLCYREAFRVAFSESNGVSLLLKQCLADYLGALGLPPAMLFPLVVQYLICRIPLLLSIGNVTGFEDTVWCLQAIAEGQVDLEAWKDLGSRV